MSRLAFRSSSHPVSRFVSRSIAAPAVTALLVVWATAASAQTAPPSPPPRTLTVVGSAEIQAAPDIALVSAGVVTSGESAATTLQANSAALAKVLDAIRALGIDPKDIQTSGLSLEAQYSRPEKASTERPRIIGYMATNGVGIRVRDLSKLGALLDKVTVAGANRIDGIDFVVSDQSGKLDEARRQAVADARRKADLYAQAGGFALGKVLTLTEETASPPRPMVRMAKSLAPAAAPVPVEAGEMTLSVRLHVVWTLAD